MEVKVSLLNLRMKKQHHRSLNIHEAVIMAINCKQTFSYEDFYPTPSGKMSIKYCTTLSK